MQIRIAAKLTILLLLASLFPLLVFGGIALWQLTKATEISVTQGNVNVSRRAAEQISQYVNNALTLLESTAENINHADLKDWQKERILKNYLNRFNEFNELTIYTPEGKVVATSELRERTRSPRVEEALKRASSGRPFLSTVFIREDLSPAMVAAYPIHRFAEVTGVLIGELNLLEMWHLVDSIKVGQYGILQVIDQNDHLIATGEGRRKTEVFQEKTFEPVAALPAILGPKGTEFVNPLKEKVLAVGTQLKEPLKWTVVVEQPVAEAYALARRIRLLLIGMMGLILLIALSLGFYGARKDVVNPIMILTQATEELAKGNLDYRVNLKTKDEFADLGEAFNQMAFRLKDLQGKLILEERHAMFGRIASGLAHDLKHPIQAIETSSRLMDKLYDDPEYRATFQKTVEREFEKINGFLKNLHNLTHEIPHHPVPLKLSTILTDTLATFEPEAARQGVQLVKNFPRDLPAIQGDPQSLNRALSNLISNALQAMNHHGTLIVSAEGKEKEVRIKVQDTGMGIPEERIKTLFDDFVTTKHHGLGLGLAIVKKIVSQHGGRVTVESRVGHGTTFQVSLPLVG